MPTVNMSTLDRALRILAGVFLLALFFALPELSWRWVFWIGLVPLATAALGHCPAYRLIGWSSKPDSDGDDTARA